MSRAALAVLVLAAVASVVVLIVPLSLGAAALALAVLASVAAVLALRVCLALSRTAVAALVLAAATVVALMTLGNSRSSGVHEPVRIASGTCQQNPRTAYVVTRVYIVNTSPLNAYAEVEFEYRYDDGGDTFDNPTWSPPQPGVPNTWGKRTFVPAGGGVWMVFNHVYDAGLHNVTRCLASVNTSEDTSSLTVLPSL